MFTEDESIRLGLLDRYQQTQNRLSALKVENEEVHIFISHSEFFFLHMLICYFSLIDGVNQYAWPVNTVEHKYLLL